MESGWTSPTASWAAGASGSAMTAPRVSASPARMAPHACPRASTSSSAYAGMASKASELAQALGGRGTERSVAAPARAHSPLPWPTGDLCEHEENPCQLHEPCLHGGTCQGTRCLCPPGFSGPRCQQGNHCGFSPPPPWGLGAGHSPPPGPCLSPQALYMASQSPTGILKAVGATVRTCCDQPGR